MSKIKTLSKILKLKEGRQKELELEVKKMNAMVNAEQSKLYDLKKEYTDTLDLFNKKSAETYINAHEISSLYNYIAHINNRIEEQHKACLQKQDELKSLNNILIAAHKDKKMFEKVTDRVVKKELKDKASLEQKATDFSTITRHSTKKDIG